jgi:hypothetical protein
MVSSALFANKLEFSAATPANADVVMRASRREMLTGKLAVIRLVLSDLCAHVINSIAILTAKIMIFEDQTQQLEWLDTIEYA